MIPVGRNVRMVHIDIVLDFDDRRGARRVVDVGKIPRHLVAECKFHLVGARNAANRYAIGERHNATAHRLAGVVQPYRVGNPPERKPEADVVRMRRRRHRIHVAAGINLEVVNGSPEAASLHNALAKAVSVGGTRKVSDRVFAKIAKPVIHPFHDVTGHVAQARPRQGRTYRMHCIKSRTGIPRIGRIPVGLGREHPLRLRRQAESHGHGAEGITFKIRAMLVVVYHGIGIGVSRIHAGSLALRVRIKHRIVVGHVGHGHRIACACHHKPRHILHDRIELTAGHLGFAHKVIVGERDLHLGAFIGLGRNFIRTDIDVFPGGAHLFKSRQAVGERR